VNFKDGDSDRMVRFLNRMLVPPHDKVALQAEGMGRRLHEPISDDSWGNLELLWSSHLYDLSGYGKMSRETLLRLAHTFRIGLSREDISRELTLVDPYTEARLNAHLRISVSPQAPLVRAYTPLLEIPKDRHRICWTMMETERVHPDFIRRLNKHYDELWTPSQWGLDSFQSSGLAIPGHVIPLGVDPLTYRPKPGKLPPCHLLTTSRLGTKEPPEGFVFVTAGVPSFRKGFDVLLSAFEEAFAGDPDVSLVLATTVYSASAAKFDLWPGQAPENRKARVYELTGRFSESEMAGLYNACHAYATCSRGEGWNLPLTEAASCGLPVVAPRVSAHTEFLDSTNAFTFEADDFRPYPGTESVCEWYEGQSFAHYGDTARSALVAALRKAKANGLRGKLLTELIRTKYTWNHTAAKAAERLVKITDRS
jgi:glycosyltransferase involved in cell wall biosynthesis